MTITTAPTEIKRADKIPFRVVLDVTDDLYRGISPHHAAHTHRCIIVEEGATVDQREVHRPSWPRLWQTSTAGVTHYTIHNGGAPAFCDRHNYAGQLRDWLNWRRRLIHDEQVTREGGAWSTLDYGILDVEYWHHFGAPNVAALYAALGLRDPEVASTIHNIASAELYRLALGALAECVGACSGVYGTPFASADVLSDIINHHSATWFPVAHARPGETYPRAFRRTIAAAVKRRDRERPNIRVLPIICPSVDYSSSAPYIRAAFKAGCDGIVIFGRVPPFGSPGHADSLDFHKQLVEQDIPATMAELEAARLAAQEGSNDQ